MAINIVSISPVTGAVGVQVQEQIKVTFDTAIDISSVGIGSFFVEGSDKEVLSGPFVPINFQGTSQADIFKDPAYFGVVQGTYECNYINATDGTSVLSNHTDTSSTDSYYTQFVFTPTKPLSTLHPYKIYLSGTSTSTQKIGIASRSVFDPIANPGNSGNSAIVPHGGYRGSSSSTFTVSIVSAGAVGSATYKWKVDSGAYSPVALSHTHRRHLQEGVSLSFSSEGSFSAGDEFTFLVKPKEFLSGIQTSTFVTGESGTQALPDSTDSLISKSAPAFPRNSKSAGLAVDHTIPLNLEGDISELTQSVAFYFNKELGTSFDKKGMRVYIGPANGDTSIRSETSFTPNNVFIENGTALRIYLQSPVPVEGIGLKITSTDV